MAQTPIVILKRPSLVKEEPDEPEKVKSAPTAKTLQEREADYAAARLRILGSEAVDQQTPSSAEASDGGDPPPTEPKSAPVQDPSPPPTTETVGKVAPLMSLNCTFNRRALETVTALAELDLEDRSEPQQPNGISEMSTAVMKNGCQNGQLLAHGKQHHFCPSVPPQSFRIRQQVNSLIHPFVNSNVNYVRQHHLPHHQSNHNQQQRHHQVRAAVIQSNYPHVASAAGLMPVTQPASNFYSGQQAVPFQPNIPPPGFFASQGVGQQQYTQMYAMTGNNSFVRPQSGRGRYSDPSR